MAAKTRNLSRRRASEIQLAASVKREISSLLAPLDAWENIEAPEAYLDSRSGKYIRGLEMCLEKFREENDIQNVRAVLLDLLRMTRVGKAKAEVAISGVNKLRNPLDLSQFAESDLQSIIAKVSGTE